MTPEPKKFQLFRNDAVWAAFYRDGKSLGGIAKEFDCSVYDLSPWLTAPLVRAANAEEDPFFATEDNHELRRSGGDD